ALKLQLTDKFSFGLLYDQPFGADAEYSGQNVFVSDPSNTILAPAALDAIRTSTIDTTFNNLTADQRVGAALQAQGVNLSTPEGKAQFAATLTAYNSNPATKAAIDAGVKQGVAAKVDAGIKQINGLLGTGNTKVKVDTQNLSFVFGFQPTQNWNIYAGGVYQTVKGNVSLRGQAYSIYNGYDADIKETGGAGWLAGVAYQIPEIALKASLTYRSEIDHDVNIREKIPTLPALSLLGQDAAAAAIANSSADTT
ncbi:long-chain fatty acid transporter, partial [Acinetobacter baumannii]|nr:long-chain fatty acid transporter [Acinetobacter baumannii]